MCGIAGVRTYGKEPITAVELKILLNKLERRGTHATGIALLTAGRIHILKDAVPAWSFTAAKTTDAFLDEFLTPETTMALLHTRFATVGPPQNNDNNHPMFRGHSAVVHNGHINNHTQLFSSEKVERSCETDSDIIRGLIDKYGMTDKGLESLPKLSGSAAIAAFSEDDPETLLLARSGSPLTYGVSTVTYKLWWASELPAIQAAVKPFVNVHGLWARGPRPDVAYFTMPDNTAYLLGPKDHLTRRPFNSCTHYQQPDYSRVYGETYGNRMRSFSREHQSTIRRVLPASSSVATVDGFGFTHKIAPCNHCHTANKILKDEKFADWLCTNTACRKPLDELDKIPVDELRWRN
jgi:asparagine synthetase B (glutamine-hydrolysing)